MKKLMILGASELQLPAILEANKMGVNTIVLDIDENAIGKSFADKFYRISTLNEDKVLQVAKSEKIDGILTICSDRPMPIIAKVGALMGLNTISLETADKATNKGLMRKSFEQSEVPIPKFFICKNIDEYMRSISYFETEFIVKPSDNSGSRGIVHVNDFEQAMDAYKYSLSYSADGTVLVEEFLHGKEISVEIFVKHGVPSVIQITDKLTTGSPYFVEVGHLQPSQIESSEIQVIEKIAIQAVLSLGICTGPAHVEIMITKAGPKIIEVGSRLGGDHITTDLVNLSTGVNMVKLCILDALNQEYDLPLNIPKKAFSCIKYFNRQINKYSEVLEMMLKEDKIYSFSILNEEMKTDGIKSSSDRNGYYIIESPTLEELNQVVEKIEMYVSE